MRNRQQARSLRHAAARADMAAALLRQTMVTLSLVDADGDRLVTAEISETIAKLAHAVKAADHAQDVLSASADDLDAQPVKP
jgi:biotin-(acetyl-CoA carboxylase) ligase